MIHFNKIFIIILILTASTFAQSLSELKENIQKLLSTQNGTFAIAFQELKNPDNAILINENEVFNPGSTIKTCIMVQIYKEIFENILSLNQPVKIVNSFNSVVDNSTYNMNLGTLTWDPISYKVDSTITLYELNKNMIINSSNIGMNNCLLLVTRDSVNNLMSSLGLSNTQVNRFGDDYKAEEKGINNTSTVKDMLLLYKMLYKKELFSTDISEMMLKVLKEQKINHLLPVHLPKEVVIAHKTGTIVKGVHDCGIVYPENGRDYLIMFFSKNLDKNEDGLRIGSEISKMIYNFVTGTN